MIAEPRKHKKCVTPAKGQRIRQKNFHTAMGNSKPDSFRMELIRAKIVVRAVRFLLLHGRYKSLCKVTTYFGNIQISGGQSLI